MIDECHSTNQVAKCADLLGRIEQKLDDTLSRHENSIKEHYTRITKLETWKSWFGGIWVTVATLGAVICGIAMCLKSMAIVVRN